jgi:isochorismate synthase
MINRLEENTISNRELIQKQQIGPLLDKLSITQLSFGLIRISEETFRISICAPDRLLRIENQDWVQLGDRKGFLSIPFDEEKNPGFFIPSDIDFSEIEVYHVPKKESDENWDAFISSTSETHFKAITQKAIGAIRSGEFTKLVISRTLRQQGKNITLGTTILNLIEAYPKAHMVVFSIPGEGTWISASPEILVEQKDQEPIIRTMALAGTKTFNEGDDLKGQAWTEKEIEEQSLVTRFIKTKLDQSGHFQYQEKGPYSVQAANLVHLRTDFQVVAQSEKSFMVLAKALHPTSAVCGSPRKKAMNWIFEQEGFNRSFFSGFAGWIGEDYKKFVVLLRVCCIKNRQIQLFSGAGITEHSEPEKEWQETGEKLKTLLNWL